MLRRGVANSVAAGLLVAGVLIGVLGYYVATTYQTRTVVVMQTTTQTTTKMSTSDITFTNTQVDYSTTTSLSVSTTISTTSVYPVPANVTLAFVHVDGYYQYSVQAGSSSSSGEWSGPYSVEINNLFQGETITITASTGDNNGCRVGQVFTMQLWVNGQMVSEASTSCGASSASITYTL